jgi:hypothetical protein
MQKLASTFQCKVQKLAKEGESFLQLQQGGDDWLLQWLVQWSLQELCSDKGKTQQSFARFSREDPPHHRP